MVQKGDIVTDELVKKWNDMVRDCAALEQRCKELEDAHAQLAVDHFNAECRCDELTKRCKELEEQVKTVRELREFDKAENAALKEENRKLEEIANRTFHSSNYGAK